MLPLSRYFTDPDVQAARTMEGHTYRPLITVVYALTHKVAGLKAEWYRLQNLLVHSVNATLVFVVGVHLLGLSGGAAFVAGLLFLIHPLQVETVVWVAELSNALVFTLTLSGVLAWRRFRQTGEYRWATATLAAGVLAMLTRENGVCLIALLILMEALPIVNEKVSRQTRWFLLSVGVLVTLSYIVGRAVLLGRAGQGDLWGGSVLTHIANVFSFWTIYWQRLLWPDNLRVIYTQMIPILSSPWHWRAAMGFAAFGFFLLLTGAAWRKDPRWGYALAAFLIFWLPGSGIVPLNTPFAERLMYPMIACAGWWLGFVLQHGVPRRALFAVGAAMLALTFVTIKQIPVWKNEETLWAQAANIESENWFVWGCLGNANELIADNQTDPQRRAYFLARAKACYLRALEKNPPPSRIEMIKTRLKVL
jgi:hypothetical protein